MTLPLPVQLTAQQARQSGKLSFMFHRKLRLFFNNNEYHWYANDLSTTKLHLEKE